MSRSIVNSSGKVPGYAKDAPEKGRASRMETKVEVLNQGTRVDDLW